MDVAAVQTIYDTRETFTKTKWYRKLAAVNEPVMFSITDLGVHRRLRRMLGPAMSESSLKLLTPIIETLIETYIQRVKDDFKTQGVVDVYKWNLFLATDVVGELTFGRSFRMLQLGQVRAPPPSPLLEQFHRPTSAYGYSHLLNYRKTSILET